MKTNSRERGNVLFYVLIGVTLLAALIYAVSQSGRGSVQQVNIEKAKLLATEILEYGNTVSTAVAQLRLRGCSLDKINFENDTVGGYVNAGAPSDKTCNIFDLAGGGVTFKKPPVEAVVNGGTQRQIFSGEIEVAEVGTTCGDTPCDDLVMFSGELTKDICIEINNKLGISNPLGNPPESAADTAGTSPYIGAFGHEETLGEEPDAAPIKGKTAGCYRDTGDSANYFYKVLATR
jgi:hypothetical protein